jgi:SNF2 family DNA or RNA helicase
MGLGKTITTISLIIEKPYIYKPNVIDEDFKIETGIIHEITGVVSKATLILCPSHLTKQWSLEITKANKDLNQISFLTKVNHEKYTYQDILDADIVIVSFEFLKNIKYYANYPNLKDSTMQKYTPSMLSDTRSTRFKNIRSLFSLTKDNVNSKSNNVILEAIKWHRIVIDEGHEIYKYGYVYGYDDDYLRIFIRNLRCTNKWFVSGTPFYDQKSLINVAEFLDFKVNIKVGRNTYELDLDKAISRGLTESNVYNSILRQIYIRNTMGHVKDQINEIPPANLENIFLDLSEFENSLYMSLKICNNESYLRQLCCNIQISDKFSNGNFDKIMNFNEVKEKLIKDNEDKIKKTENSLQHLDITLPGWQARKQMLENIITSSKYLLASFKNTIEVKSECCPICRCDFDDPVVTECGHNFCYECITEVLGISAYKKECPICRKAISTSKIYKLADKMEEVTEQIDELIYKYGTKIAKLIKMCNQILLNQDNKIIIFSEWDRLLSMIGIVLKENEINNVFCKGNVHQRNAAIGAFRSELSKKRKNISTVPRVIMLSTEHAASGTNLTEATHIIFMEPHIGEYGAVKAMEDQAIGRAVRLGQTNQVNVYRLITKNTIEEDIINKYLQGLDTIADDTNNNQSNNQFPIDI